MIVIDHHEARRIPQMSDVESGAKVKSDLVEANSPSQLQAGISRGMLSRARISLAGLVCGIRSDRSVRELWAATAGAAAALFIASPPLVWWAMAILAISLALSIEYLNAALEAALDKIHPGRDPGIGLAKDLASAAAFLTNVSALAVVGFAIYSA